MKKYSLKLDVLLLAFCICAGCGINDKNNQPTSEKTVVTDGAGRKISLKLPIQRAVVANTHNTEFINSMGDAINKVVGVDSGIYHEDRKSVV